MSRATKQISFNLINLNTHILLVATILVSGQLRCINPDYQDKNWNFSGIQ